MAKQSEPIDTKLVFIKISRAISYLVYGYSLVASVFLGITFFLLLYTYGWKYSIRSSGSSSSFVKEYCDSLLLKTFAQNTKFSK